MNPKPIGNAAPEVFDDVPPVPPEQLHQLDFLLGSIECIGRQSPDGSERTVMHMHGEPTLGGHYYNVDLSWPGTMEGRWIFGWNPLDAEFNVYYIANSGSQGTATSPGWKNGKFVVTGSYAVLERNAQRVVRDVFSMGDDGHFVVHTFVWPEVGDEWKLIDVLDCQRVIGQPGHVN